MKSLFLILLALVTLTNALERPARFLDRGADGRCITVEPLSPAGSPIVLRYRFPALAVSGAEDASELRLGNAETWARPGCPVVPMVPVQVVLPPGRTVDRVETVCEGMNECVRVRVRPGDAPTPVGRTVPPATPDLTVYGSDSPYPANIAECVTIQKIRGVTVAFINLYPVRVLPKSGRIRSAGSLTLTVYTRPDALPRGAALRVVPSAVRDADNPEALSLYSAASPSRLSKSLASICNAADSFPYVIITSDSIKNAAATPNLDTLLAFRARQGLPGTLVTRETIYANYTGVDKADKLRNFIIDAYNKWETEYVVLAGDTNVIPVRYFMPSGWFVQTDYVDAPHVPTDAYYGNLEGGFNFDNDTCWGERTDGAGGAEVDLTPEVCVGRLSGNNATEISNQIFKTMAYECYDSTLVFMNKLFFFGESISPGLYSRTSLDPILYGATSPEVLVGLNTIPTLTCRTIHDSLTWRYTSYEPYIRLLRDSASVYIHLGHTFPRQIMHLGTTEVSQILNKKFPFIYSEGCEGGLFDFVGEDCISESFTTSTRYGCFAMFANSRVAWLDATARMGQFFWNAYSADNISRLGAMHARARLRLIPYMAGFTTRHIYFETILFGDPRTQIRLRREFPTRVENVAVPVLPKAGLLLSAFPNPMHSAGKIRIDGGDHSRPVRLGLYDIRGIRVRHALLPASSASMTRTWSIGGLNRLPAGLYTVRALNGNLAQSLKVLYLR